MNRSDNHWLKAEYASTHRCFIGHSQQATWREDILHALAKVLPQFGLEPWYAADHFEPTKTLRGKVVEIVANSPYGIYDLSSWQDKNGTWYQPRNVFIELGMAIVLNRPTLLLRHTSNNSWSLPPSLEGIEIIEFAGETTLIKALKLHLPHWVYAPPERDWWNRFCIFGNRKCSFREAHPRERQWQQKWLMCHLADGLDQAHLAFQQTERDEIRGCFDAVFERYDDINYGYLDELSLAEGYQFRLCSHCQTVRSTPFVIYHITPQTPAEVYITIGMSIALEKIFEYEIPKVLLVRRESDLPSLLRGYDVVEVDSSSEMKKKLKAFVPKVTRQVREAVWVGRPLPFIEFSPLLSPDPPTREGTDSNQEENLPIENKMSKLIETKLLEKIFGSDSALLERLNTMGLDRQLEHRKQLTETVEDMLAQLTPRASRILKLRYGLQDGHQRTLNEVGKMFGLSGERIRQIESEALRKLRHPERAGTLRAFLEGEVDETENNSIESWIGIPPRLLAQLRQTLIDCGPLGNNREIRNIFVDVRLSPWLNNLPEADTMTRRIEAIIAYLHNKHRADSGENALILFLHVLRDRTDLADVCHQHLTALAEELSTILGKSRSLEQDSTVELTTLEETLKIVVFDSVKQQWTSETIFTIPPHDPNQRVAQEIEFNIQLMNVGRSSVREPVIEMILTSNTDAFWNYGYQDKKALVIENAPREWRINSAYNRLEFEGGADFVCHSQGQRYLGTVKMMVPYGQPETVVTFHYRIQAEGYNCRDNFSIILKPRDEV